MSIPCRPVSSSITNGSQTENATRNSLELGPVDCAYASPFVRIVPQNAVAAIIIMMLA